MAGYPAHENAAKILANLADAAAKADADNKVKIEKVIAALDPIKDNKTFMRTQKAEKLTEVSIADSEGLKSNPNNAELIAKMDTDVAYLVERVRTMVVRMT